MAKKLYLERINTLWFLTLGVTALAAGILVYILLLESALGAFSISEASPTAIGERERPQVALLESEYTRRAHRILDPSDTAVEWVDVTLRSWRDFLLDKNRNIQFQQIDDAFLENESLDDFGVLIMPSASALSDRQIERIKAFMDRGGSVLATWTPGIYRPDGSWRGWSFIEEVFGVEFNGFVERGAGYRIYQDTFPGFTPAGIYLPERVYGERTDLTLSESFMRTQMQQQAAEANFAPLRTYRWVDTLSTPTLQNDFATARPITAPMRGIDGQIRTQDAVVVSYYTWVGGDPETQVPYPYTSTGIRRFTLRGNTPLTANINSGYRVKIQVYNQGVRMRVVNEERTHPAGFWYDFATESPLAATTELEGSSGLVYGTYGRGRFVYMGFQRDAMGLGRSDKEDYNRLGIFFSNLVKYLRHEPVIWVHDWPYPHNAAAMVTGIGEDNVGNLGGIADVLDETGTPGTYFVRPEAVGGQTNLMQRLYRNGDVGVLDDLRRNMDGSEDYQTERLRDLRERLEAMVDGPVTGYRPSTRGMLGEIRTDTLISHTMSALRDADYTYFLADSVGRRTTPKIMGTPLETLTRIGVSARSDRNLLGSLPEVSPALWTELFNEDVRRIENEGGLYVLTYSSDVLGQPVNRPVLRSVVSSLREKNFWMAAGDEVAHWWRLHRGLNTDIEQRGPARVFVRVSNDNGSVAERASVSIALGRSVDRVNIRPELVNITEPLPKDLPDCRPTPDPERAACMLSEDGTILTLEIRQLKPQQYRIFHIDLLNTDGTAVRRIATDD